MKGRRAVVAVLSALVVVMLVFLWWGSQREPRFKGKSLSAWLAEDARRPVGPWGVSVTVIDTKLEAVRAMGTNALPFLVKWMQYESPPWRVRLTSIAPRVPKRLWFLFKDKRADRAALSLTCLQILGPDVSTAMPELVRLMKQTNTVVANRALQVVDTAGKAGIPALLDVLTNRQAYVQIHYLEGCMGRLGPDGHYAVPPLLNCLTNGNWGVAVVAARWLGRVRMEPEMVVPALMTCLEAPDARVRCAAVQALGEFRGFARVAEPSLVREESDLDSGIRQAATNALQMIKADFLFQDTVHVQGF